MSRLDWCSMVAKWAEDRNLPLAAAWAAAKRSVYYETARGQHLTGASECCVFMLLDKAIQPEPRGK